MRKTVTCTDIHGKKYNVPIEKLSWRPSAYAIVIKDGSLLTSCQYGCNDLPGGGVEFGEMPEAAVLREALEETGIIVQNPRLVAAHSTFFKLSGRTLSTQSPYVQSILLYYVCDFVSGELSMKGMTEDEKEYGDMPMWYPLEMLNELQPASNDDWRSVVREAMQLK